MFQMSREVKEAMFKFLDNFKHNGVSRYIGKNMLVVSEEILGVSKRLDAVKALQEEHVTDVCQVCPSVPTCISETFLIT